MSQSLEILCLSLVFGMIKMGNLGMIWLLPFVDFSCVYLHIYVPNIKLYSSKEKLSQFLKTSCLHKNIKVFQLKKSVFQLEWLLSRNYTFIDILTNVKKILAYIQHN